MANDLCTALSADLAAECQAVLANYPHRRLLVGFSGGRDSHVLLDVLYQLHQSGRIAVPLTAIHVNHGLNPNACDWAKHCQAICEAYGIELIIANVSQRPNVGESIEAFARQQRYALISPHVDKDTVFLSAHHRRDQAETFLLQLMRGAGLDGLQSMPVIKPFGAGQYLRPLLNVGYEKIVQYAENSLLDFIHDDSNDNRRFDRNYIRHEVLPVLKKRFPQAEQAIARSATWLGEVSNTTAPTQLLIEDLNKQPHSEQKQNIRAYFKMKTGHSLSHTHVEYLIGHHLTANSDKHPTLNVGQYVIRRYQGELLITQALPPSPQALLYGQINVGQTHVIPDIAELHWLAGQGITTEKSPLLLRPVVGSERFHPQGRGHSQTVKKLLAEYGVPTWLRSWTLGLYWQDELVAVGGIGVAKSHYAVSSQAYLPQWIISQSFVRL